MAKNHITKAEQFASRNTGNSVSVGIDVHKASYSVCLYSSIGDRVDWTMPSDIQALINILNSVDIDYHMVVYESGPCGFELCRKLRQDGFNAYVVAANKVPRPANRTAKTDILDCRKLAEYAHKGMLSPIGVPTREEEIFRKLLRYRHKSTDKISNLKREIKSIYLEMGETMPDNTEYFSMSGIEKLKVSRPDFDAVLSYMLEDLLYHMQQRKRIDAELKQIASERGSARLINSLKQVPGVGELVATSFLAEVFQPYRFVNKEQLSSYLGLAPLNNQSGSGKGTARISAGGKNRLKSLLVEASWTHKEQDNSAKELYNRILQKTGVPQKAIVAVAHRLGIKLWRISLGKTG
jgi:transposase